MVWRLALAVTGASACLMPNSAAVARDLVQVLETQQGSVVLLDRDSLETSTSGFTQMTEAIVSIDNSRVHAGAQFYAADITMRVNCSKGQFAVIRSQTYDRLGSPTYGGVAVSTQSMRAPNSIVYKAIVASICGPR